MQKVRLVAERFISASLITIVTVFLDAVFCAAANLLLQVWFIPTLCRFSYEMHLYFEGFETIPESLGNAVGFAASVVGIFPAAALAVRWNKIRRRRFVKETNGLISYKEGLRSYWRSYGVYDTILSGLVSSVTTVWFLAKERWLFPVGDTFYTLLGTVGGWLVTALLLMIAFAVGTFFAQRHWRADQLLGRLD